MSEGNHRIRSLFWALVCVVVLALLVVSLGARSWAHWHRAEALLAAGDVDRAIAHYEYAVHNYFPGNPFVGKALARMKQIVNTAVNQQQWGEARVASQGMVSSLAAVRGFYQPYQPMMIWAEEQLEKCKNY